MPEATNQQMQVFFDQRIRPFAEKWELIGVLAREHKLAIDDVFSRAIGTNAWADARTDGPPHLMQSGNSANPDDALAFNTLITAFIDLLDGAPVTDQDKVDCYNAIQSNIATLSRGVVRVIEG